MPRLARELGPPLLGVVVLLVVWGLVAALTDTSAIPSPAETWSALRDGIADGSIPEATWKSLLRLAFSSAGARLGHGRGYFDRALARVTTHTALVGVALARFLDPAEGPIPTTPADVPMHAILTERDLTICKPVS